MAEQKKSPSTNGEFKTSPLGFDKAEVMAYIVQHNKERKALKEENEELKRALEEKQQTNEGQNNELTAELEKKKGLSLTHRSLKAESRFLTKDASWLRPKKNCTLCRTNTLP